jgi:hypothetical protein
MKKVHFLKGLQLVFKQIKVKNCRLSKSSGWVGGWVGGWVEVKVFL